MKTWEEMEPRERDVWISQNIMERRIKDCHGRDWCPDELPDQIEDNLSPREWRGVVKGYVPCLGYSTDASADYEVLRKVREDKWIDNREQDYNRFWTFLAEILRSRDPYYQGTVNQRELYYMELYEPGDFSHAVYLTITENGE